MMAMASVSLMTMAQTPLGSGLDVTDFDASVKPGNDFYEYACGGWMKKHPLPAAYSRYGSFDKLQEDNDKRINAILSELQQNTYEQGTTEQKLSDLYKLAMDIDRRNQEACEPSDASYQAPGSCQEQQAAAGHPVGVDALWHAGVLLCWFWC